MLFNVADLPDPLILNSREDLPEFTGTIPTLEIAGEFFIDISVDETHVDTLEELMPWDGSKKMEPGTMLPNKTNYPN